MAVPVPAVIGTVTSADAGADAEALLQAATYDVFCEKQAHRPSAPGTGQPPAGFGVLRDLGEALRRGELVVEYQPQVALSSGETIGFEALVRWCHPNGSVTMPGDFLYAAEHPISSASSRRSSSVRRWRRVPHGGNTAIASRSPSTSRFARSRIRSSWSRAGSCSPARHPGPALEVEYTESARCCTTSWEHARRSSSSPLWEWPWPSTTSAPDTPRSNTCVRCRSTASRSTSHSSGRPVGSIAASWRP